MDKQYAIFDMDGTLVDSMSYWRNLAKEYLNLKGIMYIPDSILEKIKPMTMMESAEIFIEEFKLEGTPESIANEMNELMNRHYRKDIPLKRGVKSYLNRLHHSGVKMCVASAAEETLVEVCLQRLGIIKYFSFLLSCETLGISKSKPNIYYEAARRLGAEPQNVAVYEDALYAAETAKKAGFYVIGVFDESGEKNFDILKEISDEIIKDWQYL